MANKYSMSDGTMIEKSKIDSRIKKTKEDYKQKFFDDNGFYFCERSIRSDLPRDMSHIISVRECQDMGKSELAWCPKNIELLCRDEHLKFEQLPNKVRYAWYESRMLGMTFENFLPFNNIDIQKQNNLFNNQ